MDHFHYRQDRLFAEEVPVDEIAERFGTPCYVYSRATLERHWRAFDQAFGTRPHLICFAVKANPNLAVLNLLARLGSGFDIVSVGELERVLVAGGDPSKVVFSGVGKRRDELRRALEVGIRCFNVESETELHRLNELAGELGKRAPLSLRVNPDVDAKTHPYISTGLRENKFGIPMEWAEGLYVEAARLPHVQIQGIDCHIGSQLTDLSPFLAALDRLLVLADRLEAQGIPIQHLDLGGGLGIRYTEEQPPSPEDYARAIAQRLQDRPYEILLEPGRAIVGNAGLLLTRVELLKRTPYKRFAVLDAAMNDLLRPALYQAEQAIIPALRRPSREPEIYELVGPICETGDFLGKERALYLEPGDLLAIRSSGAYGFAMSSQYNSRPRAPEILVDGTEVHLIRPRETLEDLFRTERLLPL